MISIFSHYWSKGMSLGSFISSMEVNQSTMQRRIDEIQLTPDQMDALSRFHSPRCLAVISEAWCSDSLMNLPILAHVTQALPDCTLRVFPRSQIPELRTHWEGRGFTHIPLCVFMGEHLEELGVWMERPAAMQPFMDKWKRAHPEVAAIRADTGLTSEHKRERLAPFTDALLIEMESWYSHALQDEVIKEILTLLAA